MIHWSIVLIIFVIFIGIVIYLFSIVVQQYEELKKDLESKINSLSHNQDYINRAIHHNSETIQNINNKLILLEDIQ